MDPGIFFAPEVVRDYIGQFELADAFQQALHDIETVGPSANVPGIVSAGRGWSGDKGAPGMTSDLAARLVLTYKQATICE